jgi:hypothetical protein
MHHSIFRPVALRRYRSQSELSRPFPRPTGLDQSGTGAAGPAEQRLPHQTRLRKGAWGTTGLARMLPICRKMTVVFLLRLAWFCANSVASRPESFEVDEAATGSMRQSCRAREAGGILTLIFRAEGLPMLLRLLGQQFGAITIIPVHPKPGDAAICELERAGDHDCPRAASADIRLLPPHRLGRIDLRASRRVRRDAGHDHAEVHHPQMSAATSIAGMSQSGHRASRLRAPHHRAYESVQGGSVD